MGVARPLLAGALVAALAACGSSPQKERDEWSHATKDPLEFTNDKAECERFFSANSREEYNCLQAKGWKRKESKGFSLF